MEFKTIFEKKCNSDQKSKNDFSFGNLYEPWTIKIKDIRTLICRYFKKFAL